MKKARIVIADDHELFRRGVKATIGEVPDWAVVAEASDGQEAVRLAGSVSPDVVILDMSMPQLNGLEAARQILAIAPGTRVLMLTAHDSEQLVREVLDAGAHGYLLKSDAGRLLVTALEALLDDRPFFTTKVAQMLVEGYLHRRDAGATQSSRLSPRERHIVQLLAEGKSNKDVARTLEISVKTVETHRSNIMRKMGFTSLSDLVRYAIRNRIVEA
jgi:DNA-binding NarL/FixJ family response regulator